MATTTTIVRDKRLQNPRKIFSPSTASQPTASNYLIYMPDTLSYSIVGRSSVKNVHGKKATLILNKKTFVGEITLAGTFSRCQAELNKIQQASQSLENNRLTEINEEDENEVHDYDNNEQDIQIEKDDDNDEVDQELFSQLDELDDEQLFNQTFCKKRKFPYSHSLTNTSRRAKKSKEGHLDEVDEESRYEHETQPQTTSTKKQCSSTNDNALRSIENKMTDLSDNMLKMSHAVRQMASSTKTGSQNLDCYRNSNIQEIFSSTVDYNGQNLLEVVGKDFGDFARQVMRVLYTSYELETCILPPHRPHLARPALDPGRFGRLNEAVRVKYRLASYMYDDFFKYHLGPKLSDFLVEERRRETNKNVRKQAKLARSRITTDQPIID